MLGIAELENKPQDIVKHVYFIIKRKIQEWVLTAFLSFAKILKQISIESPVKIIWSKMRVVEHI